MDTGFIHLKSTVLLPYFRGNALSPSMPLRCFAISTILANICAMVEVGRGFDRGEVYPWEYPFFSRGFGRDGVLLAVLELSMYLNEKIYM